MNHLKELGPKLDALREEGLFCDVHICFTNDGRKIPAHKAILASCSEYFRSLFIYDNKKSVEVTIPDVTYSDMEVIVKYAYSQRATLTPENIVSVVVAADMFSILGLLKQCCDYLFDNISIENACGIYKFCQNYHLPVVAARSWRYIINNFTSLSKQSNEFLQLTSDELEKIFKTDELNISTEDHAFNALVRWISFDPRQRAAKLTQLLRSLRLGRISKETYRSQLSFFMEVSTTKEQEKELKRVNTKAYELIHMDGIGLDALEPIIALGNPMLRPRVPNEVVFVLGGWAGNDGVCKSMETFDGRVNKWYKNPELESEHPFAYFAMVAHDSKQYVIGGYTTHRVPMYLNTTKVFDPTTKLWEERAPMNTKRCYVCAAELRGYIYACGGYDGSNRHSSVERYSPGADEWVQVSSMSEVRSDAGACALEGKLYVVGGFSGEHCLDTAECFNPDTNQWTELPSMNYLRSGVTVVAHQACVYAIGGFNGQTRLVEVEKYLPSQHRWTQTNRMCNGRSNFAAAVMEQQIYVIGGYDGSGTTGSVEYYDSQKNLWTEAASLRVARSAACACTLKNLDNIRDFTFYGLEAPQADAHDPRPSLTAVTRAPANVRNTRNIET